MEHQNQYKTIVETLKILAASLENQKKYLPEFADVQEDVISSFENAFLLLPQLIENGRFSNNSIASLLRLYNKAQWCLRNISEDDFSNEEWNKVREMAKVTLSFMGEPLDTPDLNLI